VGVLFISLLSAQQTDPKPPHGLAGLVGKIPRIESIIYYGWGFFNAGLEKNQKEKNRESDLPARDSVQRPLVITGLLNTKLILDLEVEI